MIDICDYDYAASDMPSAFALQMVTFTRQLRHAQVLCDDKGNALVLETVSNAWTERLARAATVEMGGSALLAFYPMSGRQAKACVVCGTLSLYANLAWSCVKAVCRTAIRSARLLTSSAPPSSSTVA
ncbi:DUF917 family protein [Rhizobium leguminosarum]|uniref:S-methyl thiohydantoin desulfurase domain-containing protein n=1 Tax=Rhizobium leguminosarum TaxID=384 RepID=UPI0028F40BAB|nr:DUF917 family protein [Rhizobium leguminosarum]